MTGVSTVFSIGQPQPLSLAERAYDEIRRLIIRLDLAPGDVVREADLQVTLDMSRTPIREALQRLARDHFVTVIPRRGMFVSAIEFDELAMLY
ncbi:MAG: DNA-binding GntR family transcriptional regulator, partial [Ilumatobacter sp.]